MYKNKLVSIIMPVCNAEPYLREAMESILNQTYQDFEFIIINDGSSDKSLDIILEYMKMDNRIVLISRENKGIVKSRNDGIRYASGDYIAKMDSDDVSHPKRFEKQVRYLNENPHIYLLAANLDMIYEDDIKEECKKRYEGFHRRSKEPINMNRLVSSISEGHKFIQSTVMFRKEVFDIVGLYADFMCEDIELYFRIAAKGLGIAKLDEELLYYRGRNDSTSSTYNREKATSEIIRMKINYLREQLDPSFQKVKYFIWGADISGGVAYSILHETLPDSECLAYIDPMKTGMLNGFDIVNPEDVKHYPYDYVFICTQAGAKPAREFLELHGKKEVVEFFKIS